MIIELFNFELSSPPPKKSCPLITNPNEILAVPPPPKTPSKIEYPSPIITQKIIHKQEKIESKKFNKESKQSKKQNKKVCNLYPFSWRNLCFKFFLSHFFVGSECYEKTKTKTTIPRGLQQPKIPILLMETSMDLFWDMDHYELLFLSSMIFILLLYFQG